MLLKHEIRGTGLTFYVRMSKNHLTDQNISSGKLEALDLQSKLEHPKSFDQSEHLL